MEFILYTRTTSGEIYTIEKDGAEFGEMAVIYGHDDLQVIAGVRHPISEDERDQSDLAIADFVENLAAAAEVDFFQVNIYDTDNFTSIDNFDDDLDEVCDGCGCHLDEDEADDI